MQDGAAEDLEFVGSSRGGVHECGAETQHHIQHKAGVDRALNLSEDECSLG